MLSDSISEEKLGFKDNDDYDNDNDYNNNLLKTNTVNSENIPAVVMIKDKLQTDPQQENLKEISKTIKTNTDIKAELTVEKPIDDQTANLSNENISNDKQTLVRNLSADNTNQRLKYNNEELYEDAVKRRELKHKREINVIE